MTVIKNEGCLIVDTDFNVLRVIVFSSRFFVLFSFYKPNFLVNIYLLEVCLFSDVSDVEIIFSTSTHGLARIVLLGWVGEGIYSFFMQPVGLMYTKTLRENYFLCENLHSFTLAVKHRM